MDAPVTLPADTAALQAQASACGFGQRPAALWWQCQKKHPSSVDLYNLAEDPSEKTNLAASHPEKVLAMQRRLDAQAKEAGKPRASPSS